MINFYLPDFYYLYNLNSSIIELFNRHPEIFYDDICIKAVYGSFPGVIWNGGRCMTSSSTSLENMRTTVESFNNRGVAVRYTYTNCLLTEDHLNDTLANLTMDIASNGMNEVIVNSPILEEFIRENYPTYGIISSTTKRLMDREDYKKEFSKDYSMIVLDYTLNNTPALVEDPLFHENAGKCEILLNAYCNDNCPMRGRHYEELSRQQLDFSRTPYGFESCRAISDDFYTVMKSRKSFITVDTLYKLYAPSGYKNFKIEGRTMPVYDVLESYMYYMVKPENRDRARLLILRAGV